MCSSNEYPVIRAEIKAQIWTYPESAEGSETRPRDEVGGGWLGSRTKKSDSSKGTGKPLESSKQKSDSLTCISERSLGRSNQGERWDS